MKWHKFLKKSEERFIASEYSLDRLLMVLTPYTFWKRGGTPEEFFETVATFGRMVFPTADMRMMS